MNNNKPVAQFSYYTPATSQLNQQKRNSFATKTQPVSLKELVDQRFPRNCPATKMQLDKKLGAIRTKKEEDNSDTFTQLDERIILMAKRWDYTADELTWVLTQSKIKPHDWNLVCTADEKLTYV